jgi:hypothetical protein
VRQMISLEAADKALAKSQAQIKYRTIT